MTWPQWLALGSLALCTATLLFHAARLIRLGKPADLAKPSGSESAGIQYSFTTGMSPGKKESAYLHLPTYTAGLLYHAGTFLALALLILSFFNFLQTGWLARILAVLLLLSSLSGFFILIKRMTVTTLRHLSNPDDYISNLLVTLFQVATVVHLIAGEPAEGTYYLVAAALLLYLPAGKLKHVVYFFAARYQLGLFFGRRGVWR